MSTSTAIGNLGRRKHGIMRESTRDSHRTAVQRVIEAFKQNLEEPLDLDGMARIALASPFHFNRMFRQIAGIPPSQFLYALRLQMAAHLLVTTDRSVLDICYEVGYNSLGTFTRRFSELMGLPPTRLRAMARTLEPDQLMAELERSQQRAGFERSPSGAELRGMLTVPEDFEGIVMIGLFPDAIPQGRPTMGAVVVKDRYWLMNGVPDGDFFIFAVGLPGDPRACFENEMLPRGGGQKILIKDGEVEGALDLSLRAPEVTDPPILVTLPLLLREYLEVHS